MGPTIKLIFFEVGALKLQYPMLGIFRSGAATLVYATSHCLGIRMVWYVFSISQVAIGSFWLLALRTVRPRYWCITYGFSRWRSALHSWIFICCFALLANKIWDLETESSVGIIEADGEQLNALRLYPELPVLITGLHNGTVQIWKSTGTTTFRCCFLLVL